MQDRFPFDTAFQRPLIAFLGQQLQRVQLSDWGLFDIVPTRRR
jgi:hypothetical protein